MLIYCYADILGYKDMLECSGADKVHGLLDSCFSEMTKAITKLEQMMHIEGEIKTYIAFDTIVIYCDDFTCNKECFERFMLIADAIYLVFYDKNILLRGAIGTSSNYYLGVDEIKNKVAYFIINNIDTAYKLEKAQNWSSIIVFGKNLIDLCYGYGGLEDDYYERIRYLDRKHRRKNKQKDTARDSYIIPLKKKTGTIICLILLYVERVLLRLRILWIHIAELY